MDVANEKQVGGDHYKAAFQHWDFIEYNNIGYLEGNATKYVARWRKKYSDPAKRREDLIKSLHYVEKLIELVRAGVRPNHRPPKTFVLWKEFLEANDLNKCEVLVIKTLCGWTDEFDLRHARDGIELLMSSPEAY